MKPGDLVKINTDTVFDGEGVPNSLPLGMRGIVQEVGKKWVQVLTDTHVGRQVVGVELRNLTILEERERGSDPQTAGSPSSC